MKILNLIPEIEAKIETGMLNLTTVGLAQTFFRAEVKSGKVLTVQDKKDLLKKIENKSANETIREFIKISPQSMTQDKRRDLTETNTELKVTITSEVLSKLDKLDPIKKFERRSERVETIISIPRFGMCKIRKTYQLSLPLRT